MCLFHKLLIYKPIPHFQVTLIFKSTWTQKCYCRNSLQYILTKYSWFTKKHHKKQKQKHKYHIFTFSAMIFLITCKFRWLSLISLYLYILLKNLILIAIIYWLLCTKHIYMQQVYKVHDKRLWRISSYILKNIRSCIVKKKKNQKALPV